MSRLTLVAALALLASTAGAQTPLEAGTTSNTWVVGEDDLRGVRVGVGRTEDTRVTTGNVEVRTGGTWTAVPGTNPGSEVLINDLLRSIPAPPPGTPATSLFGLGAALYDAAAPAEPVVTIGPAAGEYGETVRVVIEAAPSASGTGALSLMVTLDGAPQSVAPGATSVTLYLVLNGEYQVEATASQDGATSLATASFVLSADQPRRRDTDADGVPDYWEVTHGLDPFDGNLALDTDGDGWTDFEEALRGSDATDPDDEPRDRDGDGWSDWDEERRGTNPEDSASVPAARRLTEAEYDLIGASWDDEALLSPLETTGELRIASVERTLVEAKEVDLTAWGFAVPAGDPLVAVVMPADDVRRQKAWIPSAPEVTHAAVIAAMDDEWQTLLQWRQEYESTFTALAVQALPVDTSPATVTGVALVETVFAWHANIQVGAPVRLGEDGPDVLAPALAAGTYPGGLDALYADLTTAAASGQPLAAVREAAQDLWAEGATTEGTTTWALAQLLQQDDGPISGARYGARLVWRATLAAVDSYVPPENENPWAPGADSDLDGLSNGVEVAGPATLSTNPLHPDEDGDGWGDLADPCPLSDDNGCVIDLSLAADLDGDGIIDALDNCVGVHNPTQGDLNDDLIGNLCEAVARIATPVANVTVLVGTTLKITSLKSASTSVPLIWSWHMDGVKVSQSMHLGAWTFDTPGVHVVVLHAGETTPAAVDKRTITVIAPIGPAPCLSLDCDDDDPCTEDSCSAEAGCASTPIEGCVPCESWLDCEDGDPCTADSCAGVCVQEKLADGTPCSDGDACTDGDSCVSGACVSGPPLACDDADECTLDQCDPGLGCVHPDDPNADPVACPECDTNEDCGDGVCADGQCCTPGLVRGAPPITVDSETDGVKHLCVVGDEQVVIQVNHVGGATGFFRAILKRPAGTTYSTLGTNTDLHADWGVVGIPGTWGLDLFAQTPGALYEVQWLDVPADAEVSATIGETVTVESTVPGQELMVRFDGIAGQRVGIQLTYLLGNSRLTLFAPSGAVVDGPVPRVNSHYVEVELPETGTYEYYIDPLGPQVGSLTATLWDIPPDVVAALPLDGTQVSQVIAVAGQRAIYTLDLVAGDRIYLKGWITNRCADITFYGADGAQVAYDYTCGSAGVDAFVAPATGTYELLLDPRHQDIGTVNGQAWLIPDDLTATAEIAGPGVNLPYTTPGQNGTVTFEGEAGLLVSIRVTLPAPTICMRWGLVGPTSTVFPGYITCGGWWVDAFVLPETGTYTITSNPSATTVATPTINLYSVPEDPPVVATVGGPQVTASVDVPGEKEHFVFDLIAGTTYTIKGIAPAPSHCSVWSVLDPDDQLVWGGNLRCGSPTVTLTALITGTYTMRVDPQNHLTGVLKLSVE